jgi:hypothetical protein
MAMSLGVTATACTYPLDFIRSRLSIQSASHQVSMRVVHWLCNDDDDDDDDEWSISRYIQVYGMA